MHKFSEVGSAKHFLIRCWSIWNPSQLRLPTIDQAISSWAFWPNTLTWRTMCSKTITTSCLMITSVQVPLPKLRMMVMVRNPWPDNRRSNYRGAATKPLLPLFSANLTWALSRIMVQLALVKCKQWMAAGQAQALQPLLMPGLITLGQATTIRLSA